MKRTNIILALIAVLTLTAQEAVGQVKTATINGYSPALKDSTVAECIIDMMVAARDTVIDGHFTLTVPVDGLTECLFMLEGEGCPNYFKNLYLAPGAEVTMEGDDCLFPLWPVRSQVPEQATSDSIGRYVHDVKVKFCQMDLEDTPWEVEEPLYMDMMKQTMDILPSLPIDMASLSELYDVCKYAYSKKEFPYTEELKSLVQQTVARAPESYEAQLAQINVLVNPQVLQPGDEAVDADFFDMQGNPHHLAELRGRYVLLDFWSLGCGPCRMAEPEMRAMRDAVQGRLEIVGINRDKPSGWQEAEWSKKIVWPNWSDGKMGKGGIEARYCDDFAIPYYVLLSPDQHVVWKHSGYGTGMFLGLAAAINGPNQDNGSNLQLAVRKVEVESDRTIVHFRYYGKKDYWFRIASSSYLMADGKKYRLTASDGIKPDANAFPSEKASTDTDGIMSTLCYKDFALTFEPFETIPTTFDFKEGDDKGDFVVRHISIVN